MIHQKKEPRSFRSGLAAVALVLWLLPIIIVTVTAVYLLNESYNSSLRRTAEADMASITQQAEMRLAACIEDSKAVSYDGVVRQAYRDYKQNPVQFNVYRTVTDYLTQKFTRSSAYRAAFITFLDDSLDILPYTAAPGIPRLNLLKSFTDYILPDTREVLEGQDTGIFFMTWNSRLFMVRNLLDTKFQPYAILVIELEKDEIFQSMTENNQLSHFKVSLDGVEIPLRQSDTVQDERTQEAVYAVYVDGHILRCSSTIKGQDVWGSTPMLRWSTLFIALMVIPLIIAVLWLFYKNLSHPVEVLIDANSRVQRGERGFSITEKAPNSEFAQLYSHFNTMSAELQSQFQRLYEEQQALQQAKIKALQSQINPHFLNNTLEIINWEARLADNARVCSMIEALSIMLDAAIARDGRSQVSLAEEIKYVDAYLYITQERLGERLIVTREMDSGMMHYAVPLLMLQPILENAVEHDLSINGGELCLRSYTEEDDRNVKLVFEVEHDGEVSTEGWKNIRRSLEAATPEPSKKGGSVGLRNVANRLKLLYGDHYSFTVSEVNPGRIMTRIVLPAIVCQ